MRWLACALLAGCWSVPAPAPISHTAPPEPARGDILLGDARVIERSSGGGVIVLDGNHHQARARAEVIMEGHCSGRYEIVLDAQIAMEWRIQYVCQRVVSPP